MSEESFSRTSTVRQGKYKPWVGNCTDTGKVFTLIKAQSRKCTLLRGNKKASFSHLIGSAYLRSEDKKEGGHCPAGVKNKFTACIACPSGLACNVAVDPGAEEMETKIKRNENTVKRQTIYNMLRQPNED